MRKQARPRGFSLLEVVISSAIVGVMLVAAMKSLGAATRASLTLADKGRAEILAADLLSEIVDQNYAEPTGVPLFGLEPGDDIGGRETFDDVDDYRGWTASPPEERDGDIINGYSGWRHSANVEYVDPQDLSSVVLLDMGAKRVTVTVSKNGVVLSTLRALRTSGG